MKGTCQKQGLSLRQVAARTNLSHGTIADIIKGAHPSPNTIRKLAECFAGLGYERLALEDELLVLSGYRTRRPEGQDLSPSLARLMDAASQLSGPQLSLMMRFAELLADIDQTSVSSNDIEASPVSSKASD
jgi:transcriptional regulator with XRE-family HTH domain